MIFSLFGLFSTAEAHLTFPISSHSIQSMQAARTKSTLKLVLDSNCVGVMMLSGTPMKNGKVRVELLLYLGERLINLATCGSACQSVLFSLLPWCVAIQSLSAAESSQKSLGQASASL
jgi:hypothetical protein